MAQITVRPAQTEDREAVLAFCRQTWEWGDYIAEVWEDWLGDPDGQLLVACAEDQPVGIVHMQMLNKRDAWLEGVRVDPAYRRRGIARQLDEYAIQEARRRGATAVRFFVEPSNEAGIHLAERLQMRQVGSHVLYTATPQIDPGKRPVQDRTQLATPDDLDEIIGYLNASNIFPLVGGLYALSYATCSLTGELLEEKIAAQQVYLLRRWERLDGLAIAERDSDLFSLGYIDGLTIEAISLIAYDLRRRLAAQEIPRMRAFVPDLVMVHDGFTGVGYEDEGIRYYTYEQET
jgi:GNAT superfamily N-acetyltransferase